MKTFDMLCARTTFKMGFFLFFLLGIGVSVSAWITKLPKDKDYRGKATCFMKNLGEFQTGQIRQFIDECAQANCEFDGSLTIMRCSSTKIDPLCYMSKPDLTVSYPDCCPIPLCPL